MSPAISLSVAFLIVSIFYAILGGYTITLNYKKSINWVFFCICVSIFLWAMGFSFGLIATTSAENDVWRRIAAIGWSTLSSQLLHFFLLLTEKTKLLKEWWIYGLLYAPAVVSVWIFSLSLELYDAHSDYVLTDFGWTAIENSGALHPFFQAYYGIFITLGLIITYLWGKASKNQDDRKKANLLVGAFAFALITGTAIDQILAPSLHIPQLGPILVMVPAYAIYYSIRQYGLFRQPRGEGATHILNTHTRRMVYDYISVAYFLAGFLSFYNQYILNRLLLNAFYPFPLLFTAFGVFLIIVQHGKLCEKKQDTLSIWAIALSAPVIILGFAQTAAVSVWAYPFILVIFSLVFHQRANLLVVSISFLLSQVALWIAVPHVVVTINATEYFKRLFITVLALYLAQYVHRVYIKRLDENNRQIEVQKCISDISSEFITINQENQDEKIHMMLRRAGELFEADRILFYQADMASGELHCTSEYSRSGLPSSVDRKAPLHLYKKAWMMDQFQNRQQIFIDNTAELPEAADAEKQLLWGHSVKSAVLLPVWGAQKFFGFLSIQCVTKEKKWSIDQGEVFGIIVNIMSDALKRLDAESEISYMAYHDYLTELPNRRLFVDRLNQAIYLAKRTEKILGVILIHLESVRLVNDTLGHDGGDVLVQAVAKKLASAVRESDTVARFGGDSFTCLVSNLSDGEDMHIVAEKMMAILGESYVIQGQAFRLSSSCGIAMYPFDGMDSESILKNADVAMYKARESGQNRYVICSPTLKEDQLKKIKLINSLYRALERDELYLHYQPQVNISTGEIIGVEALVRWRHPELGIISPGVFIPLAEETGLIHAIGAWVLKTANLQSMDWQYRGYRPVCMAVNVSTIQLNSQNLVDEIRDALQASGLEPGNLEIEITESVAMSETIDILDRLSAIRELGVQISIDDFGTDYSSLSRLKKLPIDKIKIDKQFIDGIEIGEMDRAIVRTIINLSQNLGLRVIAEGVETQIQIDFLRQEQCNAVQGYVYYKPMPPEEVEKLFATVVQS